MLSAEHNDQNPEIAQGTFSYGWVIVAVCAILLAIQAGIVYSFGVFFKHLVADFGWSRAATSGVFSVFFVFHGGLAVVMGWLVDRIGPTKVIAFCGFLVGLGLMLTSRITALWQIYVTYGVITGIGLSAGFTTSTATTTRWFAKNRGLALGIVSAGIGLGTLIMVPIADRLIASFGWSSAYVVLGIVAWAIMIPGAFFLRRNPEAKKGLSYSKGGSITSSGTGQHAEQSAAPLEKGITMKAATGHKPLWMLFSIYFLFNFCLQMVMVHLVNYATDIGIASLIAATFISIIGIGSILGRLIMGTASDRIGSNNALLICCVVLMLTLIFLIFAKELWMFYLFAVIFGFAYGGEVPQMAVLVERFFGLRAVAALVGIVVVGATMGGAVGAWVGGRVFDVAQSYQIAFIIAAIVGLFSTLITVALKKVRPVNVLMV